MREYFKYNYRIKGYNFTFSVRDYYGEVRIYILYRPKRFTYPGPSHLAHLYSDNNGRDYICFTGDIKSNNQAIAVAQNWAYGYINLIKYNKSF